MRALAAACVLLAALAAPLHAQDPCAPSLGGAFSSNTRLSPRAGGACLYIVTVYEGATCEPARRSWSVEVGCSEGRRMRVTDHGRLVSILAPRARNPLWPIVRVFTADGEAAHRTSLRLRDLPGADALHGPLRVTFEGANLVLTSRDGAQTVAIEILETLTPE